MAVSKTFQSVLTQGSSKILSAEKNSVDWFRKRALEVNKVDTRALINTNEPFKRIVKLSETSVGKMYMFTYDPKLKMKLPYYDVYPLIFPINYHQDGFLAMNLHYLPPMLRAKLMDSLYTLLNNDKRDKTTKLKITYDILQSSAQFKYFRPCVKRYLFDHVRSNFLYIAPDEWDIALMLPTYKFVKNTNLGSQISVSASQVHRETVRQLNV